MAGEHVHPEDLNGHRIASFCNIFVNPRDQHEIEGSSQGSGKDVETPHIVLPFLTSIWHIFGKTCSGGKYFVSRDEKMATIRILASHDLSIRNCETPPPSVRILPYGLEARSWDGAIALGLPYRSSRLTRLWMLGAFCCRSFSILHREWLFSSSGMEETPPFVTPCAIPLPL